ncbi:ABC transporter substrate-binding protein [Kribbella sandramycini]|uniref:ABC transporter substrate-binding protein n=1 Tax=Kribbella sandramycini TaxID=60450 RepID=A0A7Y4NWP6_9ACTN|nr:ABC transporter substrate-binding protein [Kribbella sandramycini]MBB6568376.1 peptide/nickel transport system substrate-binding protein [Kribbella sandramycini]NOL39032.1 ABC transporter substrate-binding protein [Kribbella sandramycini]
MQWKRITAVSATVMLAAVACGSPSSNNGGTGGDSGGQTNATQTKVMDESAKGPAAEVDGAKKGGTVTVLSDVTPSTFDPTDTYYTDGFQIQKLYLRSLTQYRLDGPDHKPVLVPDLAEDLGKVSDDKLTWTFKLKKGIKYSDGTDVKAEDYAYSIKRSFAHDLYNNGPGYQIQYFLDGDKFKGPYGPNGDSFAGVETPDDSTLVIKLRKPFGDLPFFAAFPLFTPIPKAKDTKDAYQSKPLATGPYMVQSLNPGAELKLVKNPNWDPNTDPVRHQYVDGFNFKFGLDTLKIQNQILASTGPDASAMTYSNIDATLVPELNNGNKKDQLIQGPATCNRMFPMDTRKIPLPVRKAIAAAYPYDTERKVAGWTSLAEPATSTYMSPSVPGWENYEVPGLNGKGDGDPAKAKQMLEEANAVGFEVSWYYSNDQKIATTRSQVREQALVKAGFKVKAIGVPTAKIREVTGDQNAPVNTLKSPVGWCSDWPSGSSWAPVLFRSDAIELGNSVGQLTDKALDAEIDKVNQLDPEEALKTKAWIKLDKKIMEEYLPALPIYQSRSAFLVGTNIGHPINDPSQGLPEFTSLFLKQP